MAGWGKMADVSESQALSFDPSGEWGSIRFAEFDVTFHGSVLFVYYTSKKSWRGYIFTSVCLCVCVRLSVC